MGVSLALSLSGSLSGCLTALADASRVLNLILLYFAPLSLRAWLLARRSDTMVLVLVVVLVPTFRW